MAAVKKNKFSFSAMLQLLRQAFSILTRNDPLRMAGATAFFTSFALPFILIILTQVLSLIINPQKLRKELFTDLGDIMGAASVEQVIDTFVAFRQLADNIWITIGGSVFLLMVATTLLMVIKGSINQLWLIKTERGKGFLKRIGIRLQSVLIIVATGVLVVISIAAEAAKAYTGEIIEKLSPGLAAYFSSVFTNVLSLLFVTLWFGIIFRLLPDARPTWKTAFTGGFVTAILFTIGKFVLGLLLTQSNLSSLYGASANVVLVLLFVFYTSLIMYFGAAFTGVWANYFHKPVKPLEYATKYKLTEV